MIDSKFSHALLRGGAGNFYGSLPAGPFDRSQPDRLSLGESDRQAGCRGNWLAGTLARIAASPVKISLFRQLFGILVIGILILFGIYNLGFGISHSWAADDTGSFPVQVNGDQVDYYESGKKVVAEGHVVVTYKDIKMTCQKVTAYLERKSATAEGDVVITRGEDVLTGNKVRYDFQSETGTILEGRVNAGIWHGGGEELERASREEIDIKGGYITTCDLEKPHYKIRSKEVRIYLGKRVVAKNVTVHIGNTPIFYLPVYNQPLNENFPKVNLVPGYDKKWGRYLLTSYRYNLNAKVKGNAYLDYRQKKGFGEGLDYNFKSDSLGKGYLRTYYTSEKNETEDIDRNRWRAQYRHKWEGMPDTVGVLEYHRFSDKNFIKDYFYREEFEIEPQPPSYISLINTKRNYATSLLVQKRVNNFFTEVQRLPDADLNIRNQRLFEGIPFFYKADFDASNLSRDEAVTNQYNNAIRVDTYNQLSAPLRLINLLSVDPYIGTRQTFYTREIDTDRERFRGSLYTGVDLSTNFYRAYDYKTDFMNLDIQGLRHIFTPSAGYSYIQKPTLLKEKLFPFDDVDKLDKDNKAGLSLENKLQTKRLEKNELKTVELARWVIDTDYVFWQGENRNKLTDIGSDMELKPYTWLYLRQIALCDPNGWAMRSLNTDIAAKDEKDQWRLGLGHRYEQKFSSQLTTEAEARISPKWKVRIFEMYEFKGGRAKQQEYSVTRDLHCWETELTYSVRDVHTFWIIFRLKAFPEMPLKLGTSYYRPRTGTTNE